MTNLWGWIGGWIDSAGSAASFGFTTGLLLMWLVVAYASVFIRRDEERSNRSIDAPDDQQMRWHVTHVHDDLGSLVILAAFTNALLCAILGVLLFAKAH